MERLEQFLISILLLTCTFVLNSCDMGTEQPLINEDSKSLDLFSRKVTFNGSVFSGAVYKLNDTGDTISFGYYKDGLKHGLWKKYYSEGVIKEERVFKNGKKVGLYKGFYNDGSKNFIYTFKKGEYNGTNRLWAKNGQMIEEFNYQNGQQHGSQKVWYLNGKIKSNYVIKDNRRYGLLGTKNCRNVSEEIFNY